MLKKFIFCISMLFTATSMAYNFKPDTAMTPGAYASDDLKEICSAGYPERSRNVSDRTKLKVYSNYKVDIQKCRGGCKIDHLIPLSIGGSNDISNLWPHEYSQFWSVYKKTRLEVRLRREVCGGTLPLPEARDCIAKDWTACYNRFYASNP